MKKKIIFSSFLNVILALLFISYTYSWMVTEPSRGETVDYNKELIITSSGIDVKIYYYKDNEYVLYDKNSIVIDNFAPNDSARFKMVLTNNKKVSTLTDIILSNVYGDIDVLSPYLYIKGSNPENFSFLLSDKIMKTSTYDNINVTNYIKLYDDFEVNAKTSKTIYWNIYLDKRADNSVKNKNLTIENIMFINA